MGWARRGANRISRYLAQPLFDVSGMRMCSAQDIVRVGNCFYATSADPFCVFALHEPAREISLQFERQKGYGVCRLYFGFEKDGGRIAPENCIVMDETEFAQGRTICFSEPVSIIRFDPCEYSGRFSFRQIELETGAKRDWKTIEAWPDPFVVGAEGMLSCMEQAKNENRFDPERAVLLVSHELTRTGAPQLLLKMSDQMIQMGLTPILWSFDMGVDQRLFAEHFTYACQLRPENNRAWELVKGLRALGIRRAVCNTVVSGAAAEMLSECGFEIVGLIHEMRASCDILEAKTSARALARRAGTLIFPADCVEKDFEVFSGEKPRCVKLLPQGLYKQLQHLDKTACAEEFRKKYHLPENARIVLCAGVINYGKGADLMLRTMQDLTESDPKLAQRTFFFWFGEKTRPFCCWLDVETEKLGYASKVHFEPYISDASEYSRAVTAADAFVSFSREDSMPSVLLEAMACGTPCLAFDRSGGAQELLASGRGFLASYCDTREMARLLATVLRESLTPDADAVRSYLASHGDFAVYTKEVLRCLAVTNE